MRPISIYIHIPFCEKKCAYCDFISFDNCLNRIDEYVSALCNEIRGAKLADKVYTIFIGGGTPSLLTNEQIKKLFSVLPKAEEITIETNPSSVTLGKLECWRNLGINRLSIGVQSFDDETLKKLGRIHTSKEATDTIKLAKDCGFENINIDIMHSVTSKDIFTRNLNKPLLEILPFVTHVSAYGLIIEEGKPFAPIDDKDSIQQQKQIERILKKHGFNKYEVSNFARIGYKCHHNMAYWKPFANDYIGFGIAAHSFLNGKRFSNTEKLEEYLLVYGEKNMEHKSSNSDRGYYKHKIMHKRNNKDLIIEAIMLGMRTTEGVTLELLNHKDDEVKFLKSLDLVKINKGRVIATEKGFFVLNKIIEKLTW